MGVGISLSGLASAVANVGGHRRHRHGRYRYVRADFYTNYLQANTRALRREIRKAKLLTGGILGLNIMVALSNYGDLVRWR